MGARLTFVSGAAGLVALAGSGLARAEAAPDYATLAQVSYADGKLVEASDYLDKATSKPKDLSLALGKAFYEGKAVKRDCTRAYAGLNAAAAQGSGPALLLIGDYYMNGCDAVKSATLAVTYYGLAQKAGEPEAKAKLAAAQKKVKQEANGAAQKVDDDKDFQKPHVRDSAFDDEEKGKLIYNGGRARMQGVE